MQSQIVRNRAMCAAGLIKYHLLLKLPKQIGCTIVPGNEEATRVANLERTAKEMQRDEEEAKSWRCSTCTFINSTALFPSACDVCGTSRSKGRATDQSEIRTRPIVTEARRRPSLPAVSSAMASTTTVLPASSSAPASNKRKAEQPTDAQRKPEPTVSQLSVKKSRNLSTEAVIVPSSSPLANEKIVKEDGDMVHVKRMLLCMTAVCRITVRAAPGSTSLRHGSGFLASLQQKGQTFLCIMTNNHVISSKQEAQRASAEFFDLNDSTTSVTVSLRPSILFITDAKLDFSLIACNRANLRGWLKPLDLHECLDVAIRDGDVVHIIQHPGGGEKHMSMQKVTEIKGTRIAYLADTLPGSSGSPVFKNWKLVGLHNQGSSVHNMGILMRSILERCGIASSTNPSTVRTAPKASLGVLLAHTSAIKAASASQPLPQPSPPTEKPAVASSSQPSPQLPTPTSGSPPPPAAAPASASIGSTSLRITNAGETITVYSLDNAETSTWSMQRVRGLIEASSMAEGSLRRVHKVWVMGKFYVIKFFKAYVVDTLNLHDEQDLVLLLQKEVAMQWHVRSLSKKWNSLGMPKNVGVNPLYVIQLADRRPPVWGVMEPLLEGAYVKYNDNNGGVFAQEGRIRETPQTFSHFSYMATKGEMLVCDLQGVGDVFTDPQVHTDPRERCPVPGNRGLEGIRDFFNSHQCTPLCHMMLHKLQASNS